ncbi:RNAse III [Tissierella praeacuta DSM 18095]|uniref:Ribonuclease 3 n=1 Tax=Tissierella praeacuta DSM 18095 TaxID=1123404 RepID=A0A1M4SP60_9FIRM|nr:ribonuclease III [Tissierella praeacuta]TCU70621.1 RNAse III [Tissierella praeacuta]SHE33976.1 RNAse III [Tissierella praeacuta DSM 18095]SUP01616.1 Ribonuclease 3 [Tissierella praeacuta]
MKGKTKEFKWLEPLEENLNYKFKDIKLLKTALTHSSYANENKMKITDNNERLEFLGDTILSLIVSQYLYKKYPYYPEGELTKIRAKVVCESSLAFAARKINLGDYLLLGKGEEATGGRDRDSILADAIEALVGALYMDSDFQVVNKLLLENFEADIVYAVAKGALFIDYKTELQESLQKITRAKIEYRVIKEEGPDHNKIFYMDVMIDDKIVGTGTGRNKKEAEQMAAKEALLIMDEHHE